MFVAKHASAHAHTHLTAHVQMKHNLRRKVDLAHKVHGRKRCVHTPITRHKVTRPGTLCLQIGAEEDMHAEQFTSVLKVRFLQFTRLLVNHTNTQVG